MISKMGALLILLGVGGVYLAANLLFHVLATPLMFPYSGSSYTKETFSRSVVTSKGDRITLRYEPVETARYLVLYHHGNGEDIGHLGPRLPVFHQKGLAVLAYDYPGYGQSTGNPTEAGVYAAAEAAFDHAVSDLKWDPDRIIQWGRSIGGGPALYLATTTSTPPVGVILECTFESIQRVVTRIPLFVPDRFPNHLRIRKLGSPLLLLHGESDTIIPARHGRNLFEAAPEPKDAWFPQEAGHNNLFEIAPAELDREINNFLNKLPAPPSIEPQPIPPS